MDPRKTWICPNCGARLTDEQRVREGCDNCRRIAWEEEMRIKYKQEVKS